MIHVRILNTNDVDVMLPCLGVGVFYGVVGLEGVHVKRFDRSRWKLCSQRWIIFKIFGAIITTQA
jgi:hypothetical protein